MRIQAAIKGCLASKEEMLARPKDWKGTGSAIDLGRRKDSTKVRKLSALHAKGAALGEDWNITPEDLLGLWELVTLEDLRLEIS